MNGFNVGEAREVLCVEGENTLDTMNMHGSGEPGIVNLDAGDTMRYKEPTPLNMNIECVG